jgi:hypothetical protein
MDGIGAERAADPPLAELGRRSSGDATRLGPGRPGHRPALHDAGGHGPPLAPGVPRGIGFLTEIGHSARRAAAGMGAPGGRDRRLDAESRTSNAPGPSGAPRNRSPAPSTGPTCPNCPTARPVARRQGRAHGHPRAGPRPRRAAGGRGLCGDLARRRRGALREPGPRPPARVQPPWAAPGRCGRTLRLPQREARAHAAPRRRAGGPAHAALGLGTDRPAHVLFRVTAPGLRPLVTHVFDRDDPLVGRDPLFGVRPELLSPSAPPRGTGTARPSGSA